MYGAYRDTLTSQGYIVLPVTAYDKKPSMGLTGWNYDIYEPPRSSHYDKESVGIICRSGVVALDSDIEDETAAEAFHSFVLSKFPNVLVRIGRPPRRLYLFRCNESLRNSGIRVIPSEKGSTRIWAGNKFFVAFGIHPITRKKYVWERERSPLIVGAAALPLLSKADAQILIDKSNGLCAVSDSAGVSSTFNDNDDDDEMTFVLMANPLGVPVENIRQDLLLLNPDMDREDWLHVLMAVHHETRGSAEGLCTVDEWSAKGKKYKAGEVERYWEGFHGRTHPITYATVKGLVKEISPFIETESIPPVEELLAQEPSKEEKPAVLWTAQGETLTRFFMQPVKPREFIVPNFLAKRTVGFIYGEGGAFKSLAALQLVIYRTLADRIPELNWLAHISMSGSFGRSIFVSAEDGFDDLQRRLADSIAAIACEYKIEESAVKTAVGENLLILSQEDWLKDKHWFLLDNTLDYEKDIRSRNKSKALIRLIREFGADLVILETFSRLFNMNENDNREAARVVSYLEQLRNVTGAAFLVVAHAGKQNRSADTDVHGQNSLRGASALMDNARFGLRFRSMGEDEQGGIRISVRHAKAWNCSRHQDIEVAARYPDFVKVEKPKIPVTDREMQVRSTILAFIAGNPGCTTVDLQAGTRFRAAAIRAALRTLLESGMVNKRNEGRTVMYEVGEELF
jgi:putative DNA primase/helicase